MRDDSYLRPLRLRSRRGGASQDQSLRIALLRQLGWPLRGGSAGGAKARIAVKPNGAFDRRCIVKARIVTASGERLAASTRAHLSYVEREGVERDGSEGRVYAEPQVQSASSETSTRDALLAPVAGEKHQFRLIVSPEDGAQLDLTQFTRDLMQQIEADTGRRLIWGAVNHYNTDNPHVHLIIRGVDRDGNEVRLDRAYISRGIRGRAQEIVTRELGARTLDERRRQLQREITAGRLTSLDRRIQRLAVDHVVARKALDPFQLERMRVLVTMGLATAIRGGWQLDPDWAAALKAAGERNDIIKQMHAAMRESGDVARYQIVKRFDVLPLDVRDAQRRSNRAETMTVSGRVVAKGLSDRTPDAMYAVVESPSGAAYYVPLWKSELEKVREGDLVELRQLQDSWTHEFDESLAALSGDEQNVLGEQSLQASFEARLQELQGVGIAAVGEGGVWALGADFRERLQAEAPTLETERSTPVDQLLELADRKDGTFKVADLVTAVSARVGLLVEQGLAATDDEGRWNIGQDFRTQLATLDQEQPKCHVSMRREPMSLDQQVTYVGPTWLDSITATEQQALGRELVALQKQREVFLAGRAGPRDEKRIPALRRLQREALEDRLAQELHFAPGKLDGFRGHFDRIETCPNGNRYGVIIDESEGQFAVCAVGKKAARHAGRYVELSFVVSEYDGSLKLAIAPIREPKRDHDRRSDRGRDRDGIER